jgi:hypothetical protein
MPKILEHQDFSESAQNVWAEMKLFSTFIIFMGQNKIPKLPEIFEHPPSPHILSENAFHPIQFARNYRAE